jgi:hypothetical protein
LPNFISEEEIEKALDYLRDSAFPAAKARAERNYVEDFAKILLNKLKQEHRKQGAKTVAEQERDAYADDRYLQHLEAIREAVEIDAKMTFLRQAAEAKLDAWRTLMATERAMKL